MEQDKSATRLSISQVCKKLKLSKRSVQRIAKSKGITQDLEGYIFTNESVRQMRQKDPATSRNKGRSKEDVLRDLEQALHESDNGNLIQVFSKEEYKTFEAALIERKHLLDKVAELREWKDAFTRYTNQRNIIEARDKGLINELDIVEVSEVDTVLAKPSLDDSDLQNHLAQKRAKKVNTSGQGFKSDYYGWLKELNYEEDEK
jgi:hypothetical protein